MDLQFILNIDAYITSATMLINGSTIHSIIGFLVNNLMNPHVYDHLFMYEVSNGRLQYSCCHPPKTRN
jgi:hypothetical protein